MNRLFLAFAFMVFPFVAAGQDTDSGDFQDPVNYFEADSVQAMADSSTSQASGDTVQYWKGEKIKRKEFDQEAWKKLIGKKNYEEKKIKEREEKKDDPEEKYSQSVPWDSDILKVVAYVLIAVLIAVVLYALMKSLSRPGSLKITRTDLKDATSEIENIEDLELGSMLTTALAERNFKLAIRLYYLNLLKTLNEAGTIQWKKDKTNREYLSELFQANYFHDDIRRLTLSYEEVWYGEHVLTDESLRQIIADFKTINQQITPSR